MRYITFALVLLAAILAWMLWVAEPQPNPDSPNPAAPQTPRETLVDLDLPTPETRSASSGQLASETELESPDESTRWSLYGNVTEGLDSSRPIAGARIRVLLSNAEPGSLVAEVHSSETGSYHLDLASLFDLSVLARNQYSLSVETDHAGRTPIRHWIPLAEFPPEERQLNLSLHVGLTLRGRVIQPNGQPATGANVMHAGLANNTHSVIIKNTYTDALGQFVLAPGDSSPEMVSASSDGFAPAQLSLQGWDLAAEPFVGTLRLRSGASISGRVFCRDNTPLAGVTVSTQHAASESSVLGTTTSFRLNCTTDAFGNFNLAGLEGTQFTLSVMEDSFGPFAAGSANIELRTSQRSVFVRVLDEQGKPLQNVMVEAYLGALEDGNFAEDTYEAEYTSTVDCRARFQLEGATAAVFRLQVEGQHAYEELVKLPADACSFNTDLRLPSELAVGQVQVELQGVQENTMEYFGVSLHSALIDQERYDLSYGGPHPVLAGNYTGRVVFETDLDNYWRPLELGSISVSANKITHIERQVELGGRVQVHVVSSSARTQEGASFQLAVLEQGGVRHSRILSEMPPPDVVHGTLRRTTASPKLGRNYVVHDVFPPGPLTLEFPVKGHERAIRSITIRAGVTLKLEVALFESD